MHALRTAHNLTRLLLVWFALYLGAAAVSPLLSPANAASTIAVCTASGMVAVHLQQGDGPAQGSASAGMHCPLCAPGGAPPASAPPVRPQRAELPVFRPLYDLPWSPRALAAAPFPARGPPLFG